MYIELQQSQTVRLLYLREFFMCFMQLLYVVTFLMDLCCSANSFTVMLADR